MNQEMISRIESVRVKFPEVDTLYQQHQTLDNQVNSLSTQSHLTPEEEAELHRLKKEKLRIRDKLESLLHSRPA